MKYVAFDIGNVLCHVNFDNFLKKISRNLNISIEKAWYFLNRTQKLHDLGLTVIRDELVDHFDLQSEVIINEIVEEWNKCILEEPLMLTLLDVLTENGVEIALLSNIGSEHMLYLKDLWKDRKGFKNSIHFFSCEVGARKPSLLYYQSFLIQHPEFKNCVYIDDIQANLDAGRKHGLKTIHFALDTFKTKEAFEAKIKSIKNLILEENS